jgi:hypothetical protein
VGLTLKSGVSLDCQNHTIRGPGDKLKNSFGIRIGASTNNSQVLGVSVSNCAVTKFWWGIFLQNARSVHIDSSHLYENGWKDPTQNGTGYGLNITNSSIIRVSGTTIENNGNEGCHLSASTGVTMDGNVLSDNGREQLYLIHADDNVVTGNRTEGGTQGLEMRFSSGNQFSFNVWGASPLHMLENDNSDNTFTYEQFEGRVRVGTDSKNNLFQLSEFTNPTGICLSVDPQSPPYVLKGYFHACATEVVTTGAVTLDRSVNNLAKLPRSAIVKFPGCTADMNLDGVVDAGDRQVIIGALSSSVGDDRFAPEADLDHDGHIDAQDLAILDGQTGPCAADLMVTAVSNPPALAVAGTKIAVTDTVRNGSGFGAGTSRTQYYLSVDASKSSGDKLLTGGRAVPALGPNAVSSGTATVTIPANTADGTYFLLACADDKQDVLESNEANNCLTAPSTIQVGKPDLLQTDVSNPPTSAPRGSRFTVTDTVQNQGGFPSGVSTTRYYLSLDSRRATGDKLLNGTRQVSSLDPGADSTNVVTVTIPKTTAVGSYFLIACADDKNAVDETNEANNCRPSASKIAVTP